MAELCRRSGGLFRLVPSEDRAPAVVCDLYALLLARYAVRYRPGTGGRFSLQVRTPAGRIEAESAGDSIPELPE